MQKNQRRSISFVLALFIVCTLTATAMAGTRELSSHNVIIGGDDATLWSNDASFRLSYLKLTWRRGILDNLNYQITVYQDSRMMLQDVQYLAEQDGVQQILWRQSAEETMGIIIDNFDESQRARKTLNKRKFFTEEIYFDFATAIVRWVIEIRGTTYHVDWNISENEITWEAVE